MLEPGIGGRHAWGRDEHTWPSSTPLQAVKSVLQPWTLVKHAVLSPAAAEFLFERQLQSVTEDIAEGTRNTRADLHERGDDQVP